MLQSIWNPHQETRATDRLRIVATLFLTLCVFISECHAEFATATRFESGRQDSVKSGWNPVFLAVNINGVEVDKVATLLRNEKNQLIVSEQDLLDWRLNTANIKMLTVEDHSYGSLDSADIMRHRLDNHTQTLFIDAPASAFVTSEIDNALKKSLEVSPVPNGGFFNYDLSWQNTGDKTSSGGLFEMGAFNQFGNGTNTMVWRNSPNQNEVIRLNTTWNQDMPNRMESLRFGDNISRSGSLGKSLRFGGVQWGTNFATRPDFVTFALPSISGEAALPSTIDLYVNQVRKLQNNVQAGPFDLTNVPVVTGQGELQLVVKDLLGRQQLVTQSYYASQNLLRPGLRDFSYEAGFTRNNFGIHQADYGAFIVSANDRLGLSQNFTRELRAEATGSQQTIGASGVWLLPKIGMAYLGTANFGGALSNDGGAGGSLLSIGTERQSSALSYGVRAQYASSQFTQLGLLPNARPRQTVTCSLGFPWGGNSFGLNYVSQSLWDGDKNELVSFNFNRSLGSFGNLSLNALHKFGDNQDTSLSVALILPLGNNRNFSVDATRQAGIDRQSIQFQGNAPEGEGFGYRVRASNQDEFFANGVMNTQVASVSTEVARFNGKTGYRAGINGGIAIAGGGVFMSRKIDDSFAVVKVDSYDNVRVYRDNQEITRTNKQGLALVPRLRGYQKNLVSIEQQDLPMDAEIDTLELKIKPPLRTGVIAEFPIRKSMHASFRLVNEGGNPLQAGTMLELEDKRMIPVAYDGRVFVSGINASNMLNGVATGSQCKFSLTLGKAGEALEDYGTVVCKGVLQ